MLVSKSLAKKIRELRVSKNMSQERFAKKLGISGKSVSAYENGICYPSIKVMEAISDIYGDNIVSNLNREIISTKIDTIKLHLKDLEDILKNELPL